MQLSIFLNHQSRQGRQWAVTSESEWISGREVNRISQNVRSNILQKRVVRTKSSDLEKDRY